MLYYQHGDLSNSVLVLLPFAVVFPWGLFYLTRLAIGKKYSETQNMILSGEPLSAAIESLEAISGDIQLRIPTGVELFQVDDPAFGLINAIKCELKVFEKAQQEKRKQLVNAYIGKKGVLYPDPDGCHAVLFVNETALRLKRISGKRVEISARPGAPPT
jgi:hypothetical protein